MSQPGNLKPWVRLWRVEHVFTGKGPFCGEDNTPVVWQEWENHCRCGRCRHPYLMPGPHQEMKIRGTGPGWTRCAYGSASRCAFLSTANMLALVGPCWLKAAQDNGFMLKVVKVPWEHHVRYEHQAVYDVDYAVTLRTTGLFEAYWQ